MQPECSPQTSIHDSAMILSQHPTVVVRSDTRRVGSITARDVATALHFDQGHMPCAVIARAVPRSGASDRALSVDWAIEVEFHCKVKSPYNSSSLSKVTLILIFITYIV